MHEEAKKWQGRYYTSLMFTAFAMVLALGGWAIVLGQGRALQKEHERFQAAKTKSEEEARLTHDKLMNCESREAAIWEGRINRAIDAWQAINQDKTQFWITQVKEWTEKTARFELSYDVDPDHSRICDARVDFKEDRKDVFELGSCRDS